MKQYQAGYILDSIDETLKEKSFNKNNISGLLRYLSFFDLEINANIDHKLENPFVFVIHNLISRGLPTRPSIFLENEFIAAFGRAELDNSDSTNQLGAIKYITNFSEEEKQNIFSALHIVDPRLKLDENNYGYTLSSSFEKDFLFKYLPSQSFEFIVQLFESQRGIDTIVKPEVAKDFHSQRVDFSLEFPYLQENTNTLYGEKKITYFNTGLIVEIDGSQHAQISQRILDSKRDDAVKETHWQTKRITDFKKTDFVDWANRSISLKIVKENYNKSIVGEWLNILQITLSPFAIARVQKTIIELILSNNLDLNEKQWNILAIERDVPCVAMALEDLKQQFKHLYSLSLLEFEFPVINLQVVSTNEFAKSFLHKAEVITIEEFTSEDNYDLLIDISMLRRSGIEKLEHNIKSKFTATIRSAHYLNSVRNICTSDFIVYKPVTIKLKNETIAPIAEVQQNLIYFLQNIFRKKEFRLGQLPILNRMLQGNSVIGILPTGGGKSLTYQLASLLQPGVTMVIDPIKSLMQDQYDNLIKNGIDCCNFINSTLSREEKEIATNCLAESKVLFTFVSPERLQIEVFRTSLKKMYLAKVYFSYCVIDEVHCVSEWGHDFRTSYLSLGRNAIEFCKTKSKCSIPLIGLTATASFDVLSDVERELSGNGLAVLGSEALVRFENTNRVELQYQIVNVEAKFERGDKVKLRIKNGKEITLPVLPIIGDEKKEIANAKKKVLLSIIGKLPENISELNKQSEVILKWSKERYLTNETIVRNIKIENFDSENFYNESNSNGGIIFCPHRSWLFGVTDRFKYETYTENIFDSHQKIIHKKGDFVLDQNKKKIQISSGKRKGVADYISNDTNYLNVGTFIGSSDEDGSAGKEIESNSFRNQRKFINNEQNIMVATKAFGMGIDKPNVRFTIHFNFPSSIESFVQEAGRAGRDRKIAQSTILFNQQKIAIFNKLFLYKLKPSLSDTAYNLLLQLKDKKFLKEDIPLLLEEINNEELIHNKKEILDNINTVFVDKEILLYFHNNAFKGKAKEMVVLNELLHEILFPNKSHLYLLAEKVKEEIDNQEVWLKLDANANRLYVNEIFPSSFGYLNIYGLNSTIYTSIFDREYSNQVLEFLRNEIKREFPNYSDSEKLKLWLNEKVRDTAEDGIEKRLKKIEYQQKIKPEIIIPFTNKYADKSNYQEKFLVLFKTKFHDSLNDDKILSCINGTFENFIHNIEEAMGKEVSFAEESFTELEQFYYCPRDKADTDKALFRLSSIGIVDDYTVDYNKKQYKVSITKKKDEEYIYRLSAFMRKYYSENRVTKALKKLDSIKENSTLKKCLLFLTNFVYEEIEAKRLRSIDDMVLACQVGMPENGNEELKEFIDLYFNSKYSKSDHKIQDKLYSLTKDTDDAKEFNFDIVWKYIDATLIDPSGAQLDNTKHLRGASLRLLRSEPENGALLLLKAYSLFVLGIGKNKNIENEAINSLAFGIKSFREKYPELTSGQLISIMEQYKKLSIENASNSQEVNKIMDNAFEEIYLESHNEWIINFNNKFLKYYDR